MREFRCPVCGGPVRSDTDYMEWVRMGSTTTCPNLCYHAEDYTGNFELHVGGREFYWHHTEEGPSRDEERAAVEFAREHWDPAWNWLAFVAEGCDLALLQPA